MANQIKVNNKIPMALRPATYAQDLAEEIENLNICAKTPQTSLPPVKMTTAIKVNDQFIYTFQKTQPSTVSELGLIEETQEVPFYTRVLDLGESSLLDCITVFICTLFHDVWNSVIGSPIKARLPSDKKNVFSTISMLSMKASNRPPLLKTALLTQHSKDSEYKQSFIAQVWILTVGFLQQILVCNISLTA